MALKKIYVLTKDLDPFDKETLLTKAWVGNVPYWDRTEYTDLSQVWHDAKEEPKALKQVVAIDDKGRSFSGNYWPREDNEYNVRYAGVYWNGDGCLSGARLLDWEKVVKWAYTADLLPKGK